MSLIWISLSKVKGLGSKRLLSLYNSFPDLSYEFLINPQNIVMLEKHINSNSILEQITDKFYMKDLIQKADDMVNLHHAQGVKVVTIDDELYPINLKRIEDPPMYLFCKGNLELLKEDNAIAVVGTRKPTEFGVRSAKRVSSIFAKMGYTIVSGLALGIDSAGHEGALRVNGKTIAVLAGGLDKIYPKENTELAEAILKKDGLLLSEIPIGGRTFKQSFVLRDRIQSGLCLGVCPVQTDIVGGTQHTIKFSKKQKRLLFCPIPTEKEKPENRGIYKLINDKEAEVLKTEDDYDRLDILMKDIKKNLHNSIQSIIEQNELFLKQKEKPLNNSQITMVQKETVSQQKLDETLDKACKIAADLNIGIDDLIHKLEERYFRL